MTQVDPALVSAKESLYETIGSDPDFSGIGLTRMDTSYPATGPVDAIYVMLQTGTLQDTLPDSWAGFPVKVAVIGTARPR